MQTREPQTFEEHLVAYLENDEDCVEEAVIPPPDTCPDSVHFMYGLAKWHIFTAVIVFIFVLILLQMVQLAIKDH